MKASIAVAIVCASLSTACTSRMSVGEHGYIPVAAVNPNAPNVLIDTSTSPARIAVDQEPLYPRSTGGRTHIKWSLPGAPSRYTFPSNGIVIHAFTGGPAPVELSCTPGRFVVNCQYRTPASGTRYKYDVNVLDPSGATLKLDPTIMN